MGTKLIFSETPANTVLTLCDIAEISKIAKEHGAYHVCDATFATPVICRPLDHGADMVIQSLTKYYEGHNMMTGGAVISKGQEGAECARQHHEPLCGLHDFADLEDHGTPCEAAE